MVFGPAEAFTPEQLSDVYDINVVSTQRVNRAALPILRKQGKGLVLWIGSSSTRGGNPPYTAPYFAAKAAMDALAVSYAGELARWNIESCIIVPGVFTSGTNHFAHAGHPGDQARANEYATGPTAGLDQQIMTGQQRVSPVGADVIEVARAVVDVVGMPFGTRPFRVHVDPADDGAQVVNAVADRIRVEYLRNIGLQDLLKPSQSHSRKSESHQLDALVGTES
jgi:NAD(P)-dependent dehydrogenase (short-subunit alcohol dehydrogenase family)